MTINIQRQKIEIKINRIFELGQAFLFFTICIYSVDSFGLSANIFFKIFHLIYIFLVLIVLFYSIGIFRTTVKISKDTFKIQNSFTNKNFQLSKVDYLVLSPGIFSTIIFKINFRSERKPIILRGRTQLFYSNPEKTRDSLVSFFIEHGIDVRVVVGK